MEYSLTGTLSKHCVCARVNISPADDNTLVIGLKVLGTGAAPDTSLSRTAALSAKAETWPGGDVLMSSLRSAGSAEQQSSGWWGFECFL